MPQIICYSIRNTKKYTKRQTSFNNSTHTGHLVNWLTTFCSASLLPLLSLLLLLRDCPVRVYECVSVWARNPACCTVLCAICLTTSKPNQTNADWWMGMRSQHQAVQKGKRFHGTDDTADFRDRMTIRIEAGD